MMPLPFLSQWVLLKQIQRGLFVGTETLLLKGVPPDRLCLIKIIELLDSFGVAERLATTLTPQTIMDGFQSLGSLQAVIHPTN